jgi:chromate reductase, NAD(P)H dehydrogenase (quinone)
MAVAFGAGDVNDPGDVVSSVLTVSGSLRANSSNSVLLRAAGLVAPAGVVVTEYAALAAIPAFSPDLDEEGAVPPAPVAHWRAALAQADAVLISSPEYAHGIPGALKNALDWVVGSGELVNKPVGILSASSASAFVHPQLIEVLTTMNAMMVPEAITVLDIPRRGADPAQIAADPSLAFALRGVLSGLAGAMTAVVLR